MRFVMRGQNVLIARLIKAVHSGAHVCTVVPAFACCQALASTLLAGVAMLAQGKRAGVTTGQIGPLAIMSGSPRGRRHLWVLDSVVGASRMSTFRMISVTSFKRSDSRTRVLP